MVTIDARSLSCLLLGLLPAVLLPATALGQEQGFDQSIAPIFIERCLDCHSGAKPKGKLDLSKKASAARVIVAGKPNESALWERVAAGEMPPKHPLPEKEKAILKVWIESGAAWGADPIDPFRVTTSKRAGADWWSLQPVRRPVLPQVMREAWPANAIDRFILAKLETRGLSPSPDADPRALVRRLYLDLVGLPPTPEDVAKFLADGPAAYGKLVDRLLASPHYGERWARHWLDIVRFGESHGFEHDELRKNAWPYRDWVIKALNTDMPFDEFARLQLAGDILHPHDPAAIAATGFLVAGGYDSVGQQQQSAAMKAVVRSDELEDIVGATGQTFLGLTVQCARCHDHKFDPVRTEEYYRLSAALGGVRHGERDITPAAAKVAHVHHIAELDRVLAALRQALAEIEAPVRTRILAERKKNPKTSLAASRPIGRWDFTKGLNDEVGGLEVKLHNGATLQSEGLNLTGGQAYASTAALGQALGAKTLAVTVRLGDLTQRGGAAVSLQSLDGTRFDAIVFGEREEGRWMPGSEGFQRTTDVGGASENEAAKRPVHIAITYQRDGTIAVYRDGMPYGKPYRAPGLLSFAPGEAVVLFGLRHSPAGGNKHLVGTIVRAELYDRAMARHEVAELAGAMSDHIADQEIERHLSEAGRDSRRILLQRIEATQAKRSQEGPAVRVYAVVPRTPEPTHLLIRGNPAEKGPLLSPGGVAALRLPADFGLGIDAPDAERRRMLAAWITDPGNPLFARVIVNRLWLYHFGVGIVDTPSDFGFNGGRPSHPELLDWLADEFAKGGYRLKHIHRLIVTSAAYRQSSRYRPEAAKLDADNRWLWRRTPQRLEAEALRDGMLAIAGQLNPLAGGPGYQDFNVTIRGATYYYEPIDTDDPALYRRSVYRTWARSGRNQLLDVHDCPDPSTTSPRRTRTTTPLQALALLNNAFVLRMADRFAERVKNEVGADLPRQIGRVYELAYSRPATDPEIARVRPFVERHGLSVFCRAVLNSNEFVYVD